MIVRLTLPGSVRLSCIGRDALQHALVASGDIGCAPCEAGGWATGGLGGPLGDELAQGVELCAELAEQPQQVTERLEVGA